MPVDNDLDLARLTELFRELHSVRAGSTQRAYLRGRIDEYVAQNAVSAEDQTLARAQGLAEVERAES